jgi:putative DNA methylase
MARNKAWVDLVVDHAASDGWRFEAHMGATTKEAEESRRKGNISRASGGTCVLTGAPIPFSYIRAEGMSGRLGTRLMAIVADGPRGRVYLSPDSAHEAIARSAEPSWRPEISLSGKSRVNLSLYGLNKFSDVFTNRQTTALATFCDLIPELRAQVEIDARDSALPSDAARLSTGGLGSSAYADAIATYLALNVTSTANSLSQVCTWDPGGAGWNTKVRNTFSRQALPMTWDFAEIGPFSGNSGSFDVNLGYLIKALAGLFPSRLPGQISMLDASSDKYPVSTAIISTDPPYYDNIGYADLSDFFYVWLKKCAGAIWPDLFRRLDTPKDRELVATPSRHGGREAAEHFFMMGMFEAITRMRETTNDAEPLSIYYAFKQSEVAEDGVTSAGWASFLQAVVNAGLVVDGTWPVRTESVGRLIGNDANALASSIVLVCRKRSENAGICMRSDFVRELRRELPNAIDDIRKAGVGPVDMQQSVIGPGMGIFTRYSKVLEDDDSAMMVKTALSLINRVWEEIENELDTNFDAETQVAVAWFATYGFEARTSGELITLANAKNIPSNALFDCGVFKDLKGKAAITARNDWWPAEIGPNDSDDERKRKRELNEHGTATVWACVQKAAAILNAEAGGGEAAGRFVAQMGLKAEAARALAYRLFEIATKKGWAAEALVYNELAQEWPKLEELASSARARVEEAAAQGTLQL